MYTHAFESTPRVQRLKEVLFLQGAKDRSTEWFKKSDFVNIAELYATEPVIIRKAHAIDEMLQKMTDRKISARTLTYTIHDDELIVGVLPMGSNGLGKVFPNYLIRDEQRIGSFSNKSELALLGHNTMNYDNLLSKGINELIREAKQKLKQLEDAKAARLAKEVEEDNKQYSLDFYKAVIISLEAVVKYANAFARLAAEEAEKCTNPVRKAELMEIERICRKVPMEKPDTFHEALQSIFTFHVALHASMNLISFGRLDQVLVKYLDKNRLKDEAYLRECTELLECFIIKAAWRLNLTTEYLVEQDHMDNNAALGVHPYYLDQRAGANNFLQNIIIGGKTPEGADATNQMTYLIINAFENVNLSTPGIYVRMYKDSPKELKTAVARMIARTKNLPGILNDDVIIPAMHNALLGFDEGISRDAFNADQIAKFQQLANDYCVDGCWEPLLNGVCDWTFGMINGMNIMMCAFNRGAALDPNPGMLRGAKMSFISEEVTSYEHFKEIFKQHMQFFVDQSAFGLYIYYMMDEFVNPSPLFSSVLGTCLERGRDKSWNGTEYNIGGTILIGVPDMINTIAAIKKWVYEEGKYTLADVLNAMRSNFTAAADDFATQKMYNKMKVDFRSNSPKFGNHDPETNEIGNFIIETFYNAVMESKKMADRVFLEPATDIETLRLRKIAGYYGAALKERFPYDFNIRFTAGCGTFEQYPLQGAGVVASADRNSGDPLVANFSPAPGTIDKSAGHVLESLKELHLERLAAGAITDLCIDESVASEEYIFGLLTKFVENGGNMLTLTVGNRAEFQKIYELSVAATKMENREAAYEQLAQYRNINVRVGGWQAPFISMTLSQQENYINRVLK